MGTNRTNGPAPSGGQASGRPDFGLDAALAEIDRLNPVHPIRWVLRAAACYNYNDAQAWHAEMQRALADAAYQLGISREEVLRLVNPPRRSLTRDARNGNLPTN